VQPVRKGIGILTLKNSGGEGKGKTRRGENRIDGLEGVLVKWKKPYMLGKRGTNRRRKL